MPASFARVPRILLANEFGAGRGHLVTLAKVGEAFGQGFVFDAALCRREHERELAALSPSIFDGASLCYSASYAARRGGLKTATWGEFLGDLGFDSEQRIRDIVTWWREVFTSRGVDLVVGEYAPLALLAARSLGIPTMAAGQGYGLPPFDMPSFPLLDPDVSVCVHDERQLLAHVNAVACEVGLPALEGLPEVYRADLTMVQTLPLLDPYQRWRSSAYMLPVTDIAANAAPEGMGDEVFVYFSTRELDIPGVVETLEQLPFKRRGYLPGASADVSARLTASGMVVEPRPIPVDLIARRSRLILNAGQHGILSLGLFAGVPQVALPQHLEQLFHARRAEAAGVAKVVMDERRDAGVLSPLIRDAYEDTSMRSAAHLLANALRASVPLSPSTQMARAIEPFKRALLAGALGARIPKSVGADAEAKAHFSVTV